jgi:hypothetical protein
MIKRIAFFLSLTLFALVNTAHAQRFLYTGVPDREVLTFFDKLQKAVASGNRNEVSTMINYPLHVNTRSGTKFVIDSRADLMRQYDAVFTPPIRNAIVTEKPARLIGGRAGVAVGSGMVWISGVCTKTKPSKCTLGVANVNHG